MSLFSQDARKPEADYRYSEYAETAAMFDYASIGVGSFRKTDADYAYFSSDRKKRFCPAIIRPVPLRASS